MNKITTLLTITLICFNLYGQENQRKQREICIIATTHNFTKYCKPEFLIPILQKIGPDLILVEFDSTFFTSEFNFDTIKFPYLTDPEFSSVETITTHEFKRKNPKVDIRPYDISNRNDFYKKKDYFNRKPSMYQDIFKSASSDSLSDRDYRDFMLLAISLHIINNLDIKSLKELNEQATTSLAFLQNTVYMNSAINLTETIDSLTEYEEFAKWQKSFWEERNSKMIENIVNISKEYERIVIFTGNLHKYHLLLGLSSANAFNFKIKEFWEY